MSTTDMEPAAPSAADYSAHGIKQPHQVGETVLEVKDIVLRFGGVVAIKNISFDVRKGEIRAIIGPNGAGKSSMLNVINGFYHPQEGEIWFNGKKRGPMRPSGDSLMGNLIRTHWPAFLAVEPDLAFLWMVEAVDHIQHRRFSGAVWADDRSDLALADVEADILDGDDPAEAQDDVLHLEDGFANLVRLLDPMG